MVENIYLPNIGVSGYRSFSDHGVYFPQLGKVTLIVGQNNSGKSNVLRFLSEAYSGISTGTTSRWQPNPLDVHNGVSSGISLKIAQSLDCKDATTPPEWIDLAKTRNRYGAPLKVGDWQTWLHPFFEKLFSARITQLGMNTFSGAETTCLGWFNFRVGQDGVDTDEWIDCFKSFSHQEVGAVGHALHRNLTQAPYEDWCQHIVRLIAPTKPSVRVVLIPSIRQIMVDTPDNGRFDGHGLIERLAKLQNPVATEYQRDRTRFEKINAFLREVTEQDHARIEIQHDRKTILVHMNGRVLPLESVGTGLHEVIILAATATVEENSLICMEEPELHLNPILQGKLLRYLARETNNQYVIATHSATFLDTPNAEIYHVRLESGASVVTRVTGDSERFSACSDLGYRPSDFVQANCVLWVEGPSDRVYIKHWLDETFPDEFIEGVHYSIMFYGGSLLSNLHGLQLDETTADHLIALKRLNQRVGIVIDSDKKSRGASINSTKQRVVAEFGKNGFVWVTQGRTIENYVTHEQLEQAIKAVHARAIHVTKPKNEFDVPLKFKTEGSDKPEPNKVEIARRVAKCAKPDLSILDLRAKVDELAGYIRASNRR